MNRRPGALLVLFAAMLCLAFLTPKRVLSQQPCCTLPTTEATTAVGQHPITWQYRFAQTLSDEVSSSWDNHEIQESTASPGSVSCWVQDAPFPQNPGVTGSSWVVAGDNVQGQHNRWGYDSIGWISADVFDWIRSHQQQYNYQMPCVMTIHQAMSIECLDATLRVWYLSDDLTETVDVDPPVDICRAGVCGEVWR